MMITLNTIQNRTNRYRDIRNGITRTIKAKIVIIAVL
jgi:hypothetical protein